MTRQHQQGMTNVAILLTILGVLIVFRAAMVLLPLYFDDTEVGIILDNVEAAGTITTRSSDKVIKSELERRLSNNGINITTDGVRVSRTRDALTIVWDYENRGHFLANIDFVLTFQRQKVISQ
jgi:FlaG/FlaF family flagellin (archaellin)